MKLKRSRTIPLILLAYLIFMGFYAWPGRNPHVSFTQYWITMGVTFVCIIILSYTLKRRDEFREKHKTGKRDSLNEPKKEDN